MDKIVKKLLGYGLKEHNLIQSFGLLIARLIGGFGMTLHGMAKITSPTSWMGNMLPGWLQCMVTICEFGGGLALMAGAMTRLTSVSMIFTMIGAILYGHVAVADPLYRITVGPSNEGPGTSFWGLPMWLAKADGHSTFGSGSAELAILYLVIGFCLFSAGAGKYSIDFWLKNHFDKK